MDPGRAIERRIILSYLPNAARGAVAALLDLDDRLARIVAAARDPLIGQMRLTWWHDALTALDGDAPVHGEPILRALATRVLPRGVNGHALASIVDGWEAMLAIESDPEDALAGYARDRGEAVFELAAKLIGVSDPRLASAGAGWALASAADRSDDAGRDAHALLADVTRKRWPVPLRALSGMALLARADLHRRHPPGSVVRAARLLRHRFTGR